MLKRAYCLLTSFVVVLAVLFWLIVKLKILKYFVIVKLIL